MLYTSSIAAFFFVGCLLPAMVTGSTLSFPTSRYLHPDERLTYTSRFGRITMLTVKEDAYKVTANVKIEGLLKAFTSYNIEIFSQIDPQEFRSIHYFKREGSKKKKKNTDILIYYDKNEISQRRYREYKDKPGPREIKPFDGQTLIDPLALFYFARTRNFPDKNGRTEPFYMYSGKKIIEIVMQYERIEIDWNGKKIEAIDIKPTDELKGLLIGNYNVQLFLDAKSKVPLYLKILKLPVFGTLTMKLKGNPPKYTDTAD